MKSLFLTLNSWVSKKLFLFTMAGLVGGYLVPITNSPQLRMTAVVLFAYITLVTSMGTSFRHFLGVIKQPRIPIWILVLTHFVTPLIAWIVGIVMYPDDPVVRIGYLIGASVPIGVSSIIWTSISRGYVAVSLVAVTLDTVIVPFFMPAFFNLVIGNVAQIDYWGMALQLMLMVTIPSIVGMIWHDRSGGSIRSFSEGIGGFTSKLALLAVIFINSGVAFSGVLWTMDVLRIGLVTLFLVIMGYLVGYLGSLVFKDNSRPMQLTMMYNVGLRNISVGLVLALSYFPPAVSVPVSLYILFQQPLAAAMPLLFRNRET
jgi:predicted Na+-dependent transporter